MNTKRFFGVVLPLFFIVPAIAGCENEESQGTDVPQGNEQTQAEQSEASVTEESADNEAALEENPEAEGPGVSEVSGDFIYIPMSQDEINRLDAEGAPITTVNPDEENFSVPIVEATIDDDAELVVIDVTLERHSENVNLLKDVLRFYYNRGGGGANGLEGIRGIIVPQQEKGIECIIKNYHDYKILIYADSIRKEDMEIVRGHFATVVQLGHLDNRSVMSASCYEAPFNRRDYSMENVTIRKVTLEEDDIRIENLRDDTRVLDEIYPWEG